MPKLFDAKAFNAEAFNYRVERVPNLKTNELLKSRALSGDADIRAVFSSQNGTAYAKLAMRGLADGDAVNYDGQTDITATATKTFEQGVVVIGRAKAWTEKDFSYDITGGIDFMDNVANQVAEYWDEVFQQTLLSCLNGVFGMTGTKNLEFVNGHTLDISAGEGDAAKMSSTTLNTAMNKACGANKRKFSLVIMHSDVATNLENLNLIKHLTYTDKDGMTRDLELGTWNGRTVLIDDDMPVSEDGTYTTYVLGEGSIRYENIGAKVPSEMDRDPKTNGGEDTLYTRQRKIIAPYGISYEKASQASLSPTNAELETGANWSLVHSGEAKVADRSYINHKAIAIARILSKG